MGLLVVLLILGLGFLGVVAWVVIGLTVKSESDQRKAEANSSAILDAAFDGRADVVYKVNLVSLKFETVVAGAKERGYRLAHQAQDSPSAMTLLFERSTPMDS